MVLCVILLGSVYLVQSPATPAIASATILPPTASPSTAILANTGGSQPLFLPLITKSADNGWIMPGANPQRTSWTPEEVPGPLQPLWYKQFEPYIEPKFQIIAAYNTLYVSTAKGLYALDSDTGAEKWVYPTEFPLGQSPTINNGIAYVGGYDKKLHAINAYTGKGLWTFEAGAGFDTSPLVAEGLVMAGNRDGYFYAVHIQGSHAGQLAWKFQTGGPVNFSAAYSDGDVYFASDDSYAYALRAQSGELIWKSAKLPGAGFQSWWPVVYRDWVIFSGSNNYRTGTEPGPASMITTMELTDINTHYFTDQSGTLLGPLGQAPGDWVSQTPTIDFSKPTVTPNGSMLAVTKYLEAKPWRRSYFVLRRSNGQEYTTDFDGNGKPEYAPILWLGTHSGNRYPPVVGSDGVLYQSNVYLSNPYIAGGQVSGWQIGTPYISVVSSYWSAADEPQAYSAGGNLIYWNLCCDRISASFNVRIPDTGFATRYNSGARPPTGTWQPDREAFSFNYDLYKRIPGYDSLYYNGTDNGVFSAFGGPDGVYGFHGLQNPPIPYQGKVYMHRSNAVIAFGPKGGNTVVLPRAKVTPVNEIVPTPSVEQVRQRLAAEVQKMISAGHLRPGYSSTGIFDFWSSYVCGDDLLDYWHNPGDTIYTLIQALPYLPPDLQQQTKAYIQSEFNAYPPYLVNHIGWKDGNPREIFDLPPEVQADMQNMGPRTENFGYKGWRLNPNTFYALWKYASVFGGARSIYDLSKAKLETPPANDYLIQVPYVNNAYIAGYIGYLQLEKLAGYPESTGVRQTLNTLLSLRVQNFSKDPNPNWIQNLDWNYCRSLNVSSNFIYLVPELAQYLRDNALNQVQLALQDYARVAPEWFVSKPGTAFGEGITNHFYDYSSVFQAKAQIMQDSFADLVRYVDIPGVPVGDLFYIQNLVAVIEAASR